MRQVVTQSVLVSSGALLNSFLGLLFYILTARALGVEGFGHVSFILGLGVLVSELADLGFGSSIVKFGAGGDFPRIFSLVLVQRIVVGAVILAVLPFQIAGVAVSLLVLSLVSQSFLARQQYLAHLLVNVVGNASRLAVTALFVIRGQLTIAWVPVIFYLANGIGLVIGATILLVFYKKSIFTLNDMRQAFCKVFIYSRWLALSYGVASLAAKMDLPLLYLFGGAQMTGVYSSAQKLISVFPQVAAALENVFAPKLSLIKQYPRAFQNYVVIVGMVAAIMLASTALSGSIISLVFGQKYMEAIPVFNWLMFGLIFFFLSGPFTAWVLYHKGKSSLHLIGSVLQLLLTFGSYLVFIPRLGVWGAVGTFIGAQIVNLGYYIVIWQHVRHRS